VLTMFKWFSKLIHYLLGKSSELKDLEPKDVLLAKVILTIHQKRTHSDLVMVPLFSILPIHAIDRDNAIQDTQKRVEILAGSKQEIISIKQLNKEVLDQYLPSISGFKVVKNRVGEYISYEGNGRLSALQTVFNAEDDIWLEVEEYYFKQPQKIILSMEKVRELNGF